MKQVVLTIVVLVFTGIGCARFLGVDTRSDFGRNTKCELVVKSLTPIDEQAYSAYQKWLSIDTDHLSAEQQKDLMYLNSIDPIKFCNDNKGFFQVVTWIDPQHLTLRDKLFIIEVSNEIYAARASRPY